MAQTSVLEPEQIDREIPPSDGAEKPKRGRPNGAKTQTDVGEDEFFEACEAFSETDWGQRLTLYVWRCDPFIDNTNGGRDPKYIAIETRPVTREMLKQEHGSGTYRLWLKGQGLKSMTTNVSIENPDFPPHIPPGDWLNHPRNKRWIVWKPAIEQWWTEKTKAANPTGAVPSDSVPAWAVQFMRRVEDDLSRTRPDLPQNQVMSSMFTTLPKLLELAQSAQDPGKMIEAIMQAKNLIAPAAGAGPDPLLMKMLDSAIDDRKRAEDQRREDLQRMEDQRRKDADTARAELAELRKQNADLLQTMLNRANTPPAENMAQQFEGYAKAISTITELAQSAAPAAAPGEWWQEALKSLFQNAGPMLGPLFARMAMPPTPRPPQFPQQPAQLTTALPPAASPPAPPVQATVAPDPNQPQMDSMMFGLITKIAQLAGNDLELGRDGEGLADSIVFKFGEATYRQIVTSVPKEQLITLLKGIPDAWQFLAPHEAALPGFLDQFYGFAAVLDAGQEDVPEPRVEVMPKSQPVKKGKKK